MGVVSQKIGELSTGQNETFSIFFGGGWIGHPPPPLHSSRCGSVNEKRVERVEVTRELRATLATTHEPLAEGVRLLRVHDEREADATLVRTTDRAIGLNPSIRVLGEVLEITNQTLCTGGSCVADGGGVCVGLHGAALLNACVPRWLFVTRRVSEMSEV